MAIVYYGLSHWVEVKDLSLRVRLKVVRFLTNLFLQLKKVSKKKWKTESWRDFPWWI